MEFTSHTLDSTARDQVYLYRHFRTTPLPPLLVLGAGYSVWNGKASYRRKRCGFWGVEFVTQGQAIFRQDGREYRVGAGEAFILRRFSAHEYQVGEGGLLHKRFATFQGPLLENLLAQTALASQVHIRPRRPAEVARRLRGIAAALRGDLSDPFPPSEGAYGLWLELGRGQGPAYPAALSRALDFLHRSLGKNPSLAEIQAAAGLGAKNLAALFRHHLGRSPMQVLQAEKMRRAAYLLRAGGRSVKSIAIELGFEDPLYFSARFKHFTGQSPRDFRESERGRDPD